MPSGAEIVNKIREYFVVDARQATTQLGALQNKARAVGATFGQLRGTIGGLTRTLSGPFALLGVGGAVGGLTMLTRYIVGVARETEATDMRLSSLLQSAARVTNAPWKGFKEARNLAKSFREEAEQLAIKIPGTSADIIESLEAIVFPLSKAGRSPRVMLDLARDITVLQKVSGLNRGVVARDIRDLLGGRYSRQLIQTPVLREQGKAIAELARTDVGAAITELQKIIAVPQEAIDAFGETFEAKITTAEMLLKKLTRKAAVPLMNFFVAKLQEAFDWFEKNKAEAERIAREVGEGIVSAIKAAASAAAWLVENWQTIAMVAATFAGVTLVRAVAQMGQLVFQAGQFVAQLLRGRAIAAGGTAGAGGIGLGRGIGLAAFATSAAISATTEESSVADFIAGGPGLVAMKDRVARTLAYRQQVGQSALGIIDALAADRGMRGPIEAFLGGPQMPEEVAVKTPGIDAEFAAKDSPFAGEALADAMIRKTITGVGKAERKRKRGGGRAKVRTLEVDRLEMRGESLARLASPFVLGVQQRASIDRPLSATVGLGGLRIPNGR